MKQDQLVFQVSTKQYVGATGGEVLQALQILGGVFGRDERGPGRVVERAVSGAENQRWQFYGQVGHRRRSLQSKWP